MNYYSYFLALIFLSGCANFVKVYDVDKVTIRKIELPAEEVVYVCRTLLGPEFSQSTLKGCALRLQPDDCTIYIPNDGQHTVELIGHESLHCFGYMHKQ